MLPAPMIACPKALTESEIRAEVWKEAARIARTYDQGYDTMALSIAEEFEDYAEDWTTR